MAWSAPRTWVASETLTAALLNQELRDNLNAAFPVGSLHYFMQAGTTVETTINGFALECNAVAVARATYASLHSKVSGLGYPFGSGDGSTTFNLPDLKGRGLHGMAASGHADVNALGDSDATSVGSRTPRAPTHSHLTPAHTHGSGGLGITGAPSVSTLDFDRDSPDANAVTSVGAGTLDVNGSTDSGGGSTTGSGGSHPGAYLVAGVWAVKY